LEERSFERVGSNRTLALEARILCATNRDLGAMISAGKFRSDLFFRISVVSVGVPALRERGDDIQVLANRILKDSSASGTRPVEAFSRDAMAAIRRYPWPGNVRELRNAIEHAIVLGDTSTIEVADLPPVISDVGECRPDSKDDDDDEAFVVRLPASLASLEKKAIEAALRETKGNRSKTAALLGINRQTLYNKLAGLDKVVEAVLGSHERPPHGRT
jgi:DNA-binding NtrC family response regulator